MNLALDPPQSGGQLQNQAQNRSLLVATRGDAELNSERNACYNTKPARTIMANRANPIQTNNRLQLTLIALTAFALAACGPRKKADIGDIRAEANAETGAVSFSHQEDVFLRTAAEAPVQVLEFEPDVSMVFGLFEFEKDNEEVRDLELLEARKRQGNLELEYGGADTEVTVTVSEDANGLLKAEVAATNDSVSAVRLNWQCTEKDHFLGLGEQFNTTDQRGWEVPIWVSEQGLGREPDPQLPFVGDLTDTYFPMGYFLNPLRGYGFIVDTPHYAHFDFCASTEDIWSLEVWEPKGFSMLIGAAGTPKEAMGKTTQALGRSKRPPDWAFKPWLSAQGGTQEVQAIVDKVIDENIDLGAIWSQDWLGERPVPEDGWGVTYHWVHDEEHYPNLEQLIDNIHAAGMHFLGYFNPFIHPELQHYPTAEEKGYLVGDANGDPFLTIVGPFEAGQVDLTHPDAVDWVQGFMRDAVEMGMDGWMADFAEWVPYDATLHDGRTGASYHNIYPIDWQRTSLELLEELRPSGDYVVFTRSGHTFSPGEVQVVWPGDQEAEFEPYDGIATVLPAAINMGISGVPYFGHDIAGFSGGPSTKELFFRSMAMGAFMPIMRTHDGLKRELNHNFQSDADTLASFRDYVSIHNSLVPYLLELADQYETSGAPIVRHLILEFPNDTKTLGIDDQYMLGPDYLVAPVVTEDATSRSVYLPEGTWYNIWTGDQHEGPKDIEVAAPLHQIPVFSRKPVEETPLPTDVLARLQAAGD